MSGKPEVQQHQVAALDPVQRVGAATGVDDGGAGVAEELGHRRRHPLVILDKQHSHGADARYPAGKLRTVLTGSRIDGSQFVGFPLELRRGATTRP